MKYDDSRAPNYQLLPRKVSLYYYATYIKYKILTSLTTKLSTLTTKLATLTTKQP